MEETYLRAEKILLRERKGRKVGGQGRRGDACTHTAEPGNSVHEVPEKTGKGACELCLVDLALGMRKRELLHCERKEAFLDFLAGSLGTLACVW